MAADALHYVLPLSGNNEYQCAKTFRKKKGQRGLNALLPGIKSAS